MTAFDCAGSPDFGHVSAPAGPKNRNLHGARAGKNDEFYTQLTDIEKEMNAYLDFDADVFRGKTILLPCDDPEWSNFTRYFAQNFERFGLKKLVSTSYAPSSKPNAGAWKPTDLEAGSRRYDAAKSRDHGRIFVLTEDANRDGRIDIDDLDWDYLEGDGDFRSDEVRALRDEADIVITNPPFSIFREFLGWVQEARKAFVIIGNMNAITYKEVFPSIRENRMWLGATANGSDMVFRVPEGTEVREGDRQKAARLGYAGSYTRLGNSCWFSNIDHGRRHTPLQLMTMADNLKFNPKMKGKAAYDRYDNYDAIDVPFTNAIPSDYDGAMGVPISFLDKYCPEQFEIVGSFNAGAHGDELGAEETDILLNGKVKRWNGPVIRMEPQYKRIVIRKAR